MPPAEVYRDGKVIELPAWQGWARAAKEKIEQLQGLQHQEALRIPA